jgi:hypothetical protein
MGRISFGDAAGLESVDAVYTLGSSITDLEQLWLSSKAIAHSERRLLTGLASAALVV